MARLPQRAGEPRRDAEGRSHRGAAVDGALGGAAADGGGALIHNLKKKVVHVEGLVLANVPCVQLANIRTLNNKQPCKDDMYEETN